MDNFEKDKDVFCLKG